MSKKTSPNSALLIVVSIVLIAIIGFVMIQNSGNTTDTSWTTNGSNVEVRDGVQYVTVDARGGYKPRTSYAKWGIPTKLVMNTKNTYDCSAALVVRAANFREVLPENGTTEIDLGTPKSGDKIPGTCSMGMYNFSIIFN